VEFIIKRSIIRRSIMKEVYPTFIVDTKDGSENSFLVCVPDMEILTEGNSFANAIEMARDAIGVTGISMEDNKENLPIPSEANIAIDKAKQYSDDVDFTKGILTYVDVDFAEYRKKIETKTVRRNVAFQVG
jgi:predicted RNase H-like HicB family nuclease